MADFHLVALHQPLYVEGLAEEAGIGEFRGRVVAIGLRGSEPLIPAQPDGSDPVAEGLLGWGSTHFLVADESRPAPIWVPKSEVTAHRLDGGGRPSRVGSE
jgi:hypothetical protein